MIPNGPAYMNSAKILPYNGRQKSFKLIGHMPVLPHARCSTFLGNRFGPRDDAERPGLHKFCKNLAIQWAPNHSICLAVRPLAARFASNQQTDRVIWCHGWQDFLQNSCRPGSSESSLGPKRFQKNAGIERMSTLACVQSIRGTFTHPIKMRGNSSSSGGSV